MHKIDTSSLTVLAGGFNYMRGSRKFHQRVLWTSTEKQLDISIIPEFLRKPIATCDLPGGPDPTLDLPMIYHIDLLLLVLFFCFFHCVIVYTCNCTFKTISDVSSFLKLIVNGTLHYIAYTLKNVLSF